MSLALLPAPPPDLLAQFRTPTPAGEPGGGGHFTHRGFEAGRGDRSLSHWSLPATVQTASCWFPGSGHHTTLLPAERRALC